MANKGIYNKFNRSGFTLIEVLIVIIILAVLAALALPVYTTTVEKSRKEEAYDNLRAVRASMLRYKQGFPSNPYPSTYGPLDFDPTDTASDPPGTTRHYVYSATPTGGASTFSITATRNTIDRPAGVPAYTITVDQNGSIDSQY